jgi:hypothetical protein
VARAGFLIEQAEATFEEGLRRDGAEGAIPPARRPLVIE